MTSPAQLSTPDLDRLSTTLRRFEQVDRQLRLEAVPLSRSPPSPAAATTTAAEAEPFKEVAEHLEDITDVLEPAARVSASRNPFVSEAVIACPFIGIAEHFKCFSRLLEAINRRWIARIAIGVIRQCQFFVSLLDLIIRGRFRD